MDPEFRQAPPEEHDPEILLQMQAGDPEALRLLLTRHGPRAKWWLCKEFRKLSEEEVEAALNAAAHSAWTSAGSFDASRGTVRAWFYVIARNAAVAIVRQKLRDEKAITPLDLDAATLRAVPTAPEPPSGAPFLADLRNCIQGLPKMQRGIIEADLRAGDIASAAELAESFRTSKNSIYASRSIARKSLRLCLNGRGHGFSGAEPGVVR